MSRGRLAEEQVWRQEAQQEPAVECWGKGELPGSSMQKRWTLAVRKLSVSGEHTPPFCFLWK